MKAKNTTEQNTMEQNMMEPSRTGLKTKEMNTMEQRTPLSPSLAIPLLWNSRRFFLFSTVRYRSDL